MSRKYQAPRFCKSPTPVAALAIAGFSGALLGASGCAQDARRAIPAAAVSQVSAADAGVAIDANTAHLGDFHVTFYYVIGEDEVPADRPKTRQPAIAVAQASDNEDESADDQTAVDADADTALAVNDHAATVTADIAVPPVTLYNAGSCAPLAQVSHNFASQVEMQGTGQLRDGRVINISGACRCEHSPCFHETSRRWGSAGTGRSLLPFRTVAVDPAFVKLGTLLYIPTLDGLMMPGKPPYGGFRHDGCVAADDTGGNIDGNQLDLFVGRRSYYQGLARGGSSHAWARHVDVFDGSTRCERKNGIVRKAASSS